MARDLTEGSITRKLLIMAVPTMIGFGAQMFYDLVDIFWLGHLSSEAVAGVTVFSTLFWIVEALNEVIGMSSVSLISQAFGRKDAEKTDLAIEQTMTFKFLVAAIAAVILLIFLKPLMHLFVKGTAAELGLEYGYIRIFFLPIMFSSFTVNTALRCIGDAHSVMRIMIFSSLLNIVLDPFLMFSTIPFIGLPGLNMGAFGAALATIISQVAAFGLGFYILFSGKKGVRPSLKRLFRLDKAMSIKLMTIGLPNGFEVLSRNLSGAVVLWFVASFGNAAITASGIGGRLLGLAFMPLMGLSISGSAMVGQSLGAENIDRSVKAARTAAMLSAAVMASFTLVSLFFGRGIMGFFTGDAQVLDLGASYLAFGTGGLIFIGLGIGLGTAFAGSGYNVPQFVASMISRWLVQVPFLFAVWQLKLPVVWVWASILVSDAAEMAVSWLFFRRGAWKVRRV